VRSTVVESVIKCIIYLFSGVSFSIMTCVENLINNICYETREANIIIPNSKTHAGDHGDHVQVCYCSCCISIS